MARISPLVETAFTEFICTLDKPPWAIAEACQITVSSVYQWRRGHEPTDTNLVLLARFLGRPVVDVAGLCDRWQEVSQLTRARWAAGLTTAEAAARARTPERNVRAFECGRVTPDEQTAMRLEVVYGAELVPERMPAAPFTYPGSKATMASTLLGLIPNGPIYVEPFGGSGAVLLSRPPVPGTHEVLNDIDGDIINLFRVLRDPAMAEELHRRLSLTPYARAEYEDAVRILRSGEDDMVLTAWATFVVVGQGFNHSSRPSPRNWSNAASSVGRWWQRVAWVASWHERLANVTLEDADAFEVIDRYDRPGTVFYLDPPYHHDTRTNMQLYRYELDRRQHGELVGRLLDVRGAVVLSGYPHASYEILEQHGWTAHQVGGREQAWTNPTANHLLEAA